MGITIAIDSYYNKGLLLANGRASNEAHYLMECGSVRCISLNEAHFEAKTFLLRSYMTAPVSEMPCHFESEATLNRPVGKQLFVPARF